MTLNPVLDSMQAVLIDKNRERSMSYVVTGKFSSEGEYRVESRKGCKIIWGSIPISDLVGLMEHHFSEAEAFVDNDLANRIGAAFVIGTKQSLDGMRNDPSLEVSPERRMEMKQAQWEGWPEAFQEWLISGNRGMSSNAIASIVTGIGRAVTADDYPRDAGDFARCLKVIAALESDTLSEPEILDKVATGSVVWQNLAKSWSALKELHLSDAEHFSVVLKSAINGRNE